MKMVFAPYGSLVSHKLLPPGRDGRTAAILTFASVDQATWLVQNLNGNMPQGLNEPIRVRFKDQRPPQGMPAQAGLPMQGSMPSFVSNAPSEQLFVADIPAEFN